MWVYGLDWAGPGQREVADACECGTNANKWQMGFKLAFRGLKPDLCTEIKSMILQDSCGSYPSFCMYCTKVYFKSNETPT